MKFKIRNAIFPQRLWGVRSGRQYFRSEFVAEKWGTTFLNILMAIPSNFYTFGDPPAHPIPWADIYSITQYPINTDSPADWARALKSSAFLT